MSVNMLFRPCSDLLLYYLNSCISASKELTMPWFVLCEKSPCKNIVDHYWQMWYWQEVQNIDERTTALSEVVDMTEYSLWAETTWGCCESVKENNCTELVKQAAPPLAFYSCRNLNIKTWFSDSCSLWSYNWSEFMVLLLVDSGC